MGQQSPLKERTNVTHFVTKGSILFLPFLGVQPCQVILEGIFTCSVFFVNSEHCKTDVQSFRAGRRLHVLQETLDLHRIKPSAL